MPEYRFRNPVPDGVRKSVQDRAAQQWQEVLRYIGDQMAAESPRHRNETDDEDSIFDRMKQQKRNPFAEKDKKPINIYKNPFPLSDNNITKIDLDETYTEKLMRKYGLDSRTMRPLSTEEFRPLQTGFVENFVQVNGRQVLVLDDGSGTLRVKGYVERVRETPRGTVGDVKPVSEELDKILVKDAIKGAAVLASEKKVFLNLEEIAPPIEKEVVFDDPFEIIYR